PSLALEEAFGRAFDPKVAEELKAAFGKPAADAAARLALLEPLAGGKPHPDLAKAAFDLLADDPKPTAERFKLLAALLARQEPAPKYVETLLILRLAELADRPGAAPWPAESVRLALTAARLGERAAARPDAFGWLRADLEDAAQARHDGEILLFSRGFAPAA